MRQLLALLFACAMGCASQPPAQADGRELFSWNTLPPLPRAISGHFADVSNGALLVAGGSYFTTSPFAGGKKQWTNEIYALLPGGREWMPAGHLPQPLAYGGSVSTDQGIVCIGGSNGEGHHAAVFRLRWNGSSVEYSALAPLPAPLAMVGAAGLANTVYAVGGQQTPAGLAERRAWALDLDRRNAIWREMQQYTRVHCFLYAAIGAICCFSVAYGVSFITGPPERDLAGLTLSARGARQPTSLPESQAECMVAQ